MHNVASYYTRKLRHLFPACAAFLLCQHSTVRYLTLVSYCLTTRKQPRDFLSRVFSSRRCAGFRWNPRVLGFVHIEKYGRCDVYLWGGRWYYEQCVRCMRNYFIIRDKNEEYFFFYIGKQRAVIVIMSKKWKWIKNHGS